MPRVRLVVSTVILLASALNAAQPAPPAASVTASGRTLFVLRAGVGSITPAERAQLINARLRQILASPPATIKAHVDQSDVGWLVRVGDTPVISVTESDAKAEGVSAKTLADRWAAAIEEALVQAQTEGLRRTLWRRIGITALVILVGLALLWGLRLGWRRGAGSLHKQQGKIRSVRFRGLELLSGVRLHSGLMRFLGLLYTLASLLVITGSLLLVFGQFPTTQNYARAVFLWIWEPFLDIVGGIVRYLPNLFYILVIIVVTRVVLRAVEFIFGKAHEGVISLEPWVHRDVARPTSQILKAILIVLALFFIAPLIPGTGSTAAKGISVILGLAVSFGSTSTVGNLIAGIVLTYMRPFQLGDRVKIADTTGDVTQKTFLYTKLLTIKNEEVMVPSLQALSGALVNYTARAKSDGLILHTSVTIGYDAPWRRVHQLLLDAAGRTSRTLKEPKPFVLQTSLDDFYVSYQLNVYSDQPNAMASIYAELHQNIQDAFNEGGVEICSPHFRQLRDGNPTTIPSDYLKDYEPPRFLVDARTSQAAR